MLTSAPVKPKEHEIQSESPPTIPSKNTKPRLSSSQKSPTFATSEVKLSKEDTTDSVTDSSKGIKAGGTFPKSRKLTSGSEDSLKPLKSLKSKGAVLGLFDVTEKKSGTSEDHVNDASQTKLKKAATESYIDTSVVNRKESFSYTNSSPVDPVRPTITAYKPKSASLLEETPISHKVSKPSVGGVPMFDMSELRSRQNKSQEDAATKAEIDPIVKASHTKQISGNELEGRKSAGPPDLVERRQKVSAITENFSNSPIMSPIKVLKGQIDPSSLSRNKKPLLSEPSPAADSANTREDPHKPLLGKSTSLVEDKTIEKPRNVASQESASEIPPWKLELEEKRKQQNRI